MLSFKNPSDKKSQFWNDFSKWSQHIVALENKVINTSQFAILKYLEKFDGWEADHLDSKKQMATRLGMSRETLIINISKLEKLGYIELIQKGQYTHFKILIKDSIYDKHQITLIYCSLLLNEEQKRVSENPTGGDGKSDRGVSENPTGGDGKSDTIVSSIVPSIVNINSSKRVSPEENSLFFESEEKNKKLLTDKFMHNEETIIDVLRYYSSLDKNKHKKSLWYIFMTFIKREEFEQYLTLMREGQNFANRKEEEELFSNILDISKTIKKQQTELNQDDYFDSLEGQELSQDYIKKVFEDMMHTLQEQGAV